MLVQQLKPLLEKEHTEKGPAVLSPLILGAKICKSPYCQPNNVDISTNGNDSLITPQQQTWRKKEQTEKSEVKS